MAGQSDAQAEGVMLAPVVEAEREKYDGQEALVVRPSSTSPCEEATGMAGNAPDFQVAETAEND